MRRKHLFPSIVRNITTFLFVMAVFVSLGRPVFAFLPSHAVDISMGHEEILPLSGAAHLLFDRGPKISSHDDTTMPDQDMPCCLDGSEDYVLPSQTFAPTIPNGEFLTAEGISYCPVTVSRVISEQNFAPSGSPILLNCQRE